MTNWPGLIVLTALPTSSTMPQYSWPIGVGAGDRLDAAVGPQVGPAHAGGRDPDDRVGRLDDRRVVALLEAHVAGAVEDGSSHRGSRNHSGISSENHVPACVAVTGGRPVL